MKVLSIRFIGMLWLLFLLASFCAGCVMHFGTSPVVTGVVVEDLSGTPVKDAVVTVIPGKGLLKGPMRSGISRADGKFRVPSGGQFVFPVLLMPAINTPPAALAVQKRSYEPLVVPLRWDDLSISTNLGILRLRKMPDF